MTESFVDRPRFGPPALGEVDGTVEVVATGRKQVFHALDELPAVLVAQEQASAVPGGRW